MIMLSMCRIAAAFLCALHLSVAWAEGADRFFDRTFGDFQAELELARQTGKDGLLLMFEADGCPYCRKMRNTVLNRENVQSYYRSHFMIFSVDVLGALPVTDLNGASTTEKQFARALGVLATPTFVFFATNGSELVRYSGATRNPEEFLRIGEFVADGRFKFENLDNYLHSPGKP
jgi:thioredoxin-related protein